MSVALLIEYKSADRAASYVPFATQHVFMEHWAPLLKALQADSPPQAAEGIAILLDGATGGAIDPEQIPSCLAAIALVKGTLAMLEAHSEIHAEMLHRLESLHQAILEIVPSEVDSLFFG